MAEEICKKCNELKELVFAGCVCHNCSDGLDNKWKGVNATDWVLIRTCYPELRTESLRDLSDFSGATSPKARFRSYTRKYVYRNSTYPEIKLVWATRYHCKWFLRPATVEEIADKDLWDQQIIWA